MPALAGQIADPGAYGDDTRKLVTRARRVSASSTTTSSTGVGVLRIDGVTCKSGRAYRLHTGGLGLQSSVANDDAGARIVSSASGTATTASSMVKGAALWQRVPTTGVTQIAPLTGLYIPSTDETVSFLLCVQRNGGSGNVSMYGDVSDFPIDLWVEDIGPDTGDVGLSV